MNLTDQQLLQYSRHIFLPEIDIEGQRRLLNSHVLIMGMGGLGSPVAMYLAASGVGQLTLVDFDQVELSNLQRQIIHSIQSIEQDKVESARQTLQALNADVAVHIINKKLDENELESLLQTVDVVVDGTDNFASRFLVNRVCQSTATPLVSGSVIRFMGQVSVFKFNKGQGPCYQCLYDDIEAEQENCADHGVLAPAVGIIGSIQATEVLKLLLGIGESLNGKLLIMDAKNMEFQTKKLIPDPDCKICGSK